MLRSCFSVYYCGHNKARLVWEYEVRIPVYYTYVLTVNMSLFLSEHLFSRTPKARFPSICQQAAFETSNMCIVTLFLGDITRGVCCVEWSICMLCLPHYWHTRGPFYYHGLTLIPEWSNDMPSKMWHKIIHQFPIFNGFNDEVWNGWLISPHFIMDVITYLNWD